MELTEEILTAHRALSACDAGFIEYVVKESENLRRSNYSSFDEFTDEITTIQPWPVFINKHRRDEMKEATIELFNLIKSIPQRFFNGDAHKISEYYEIPSDIVDIQLVGARDVHLRNLLARGDFILSPSGLHCLEYNVGANLGGWEIPLWEQVFLGTPIISRFLKMNNVKILNQNLIHVFCSHLVNSGLEKFSEATDELNSLLVIPGSSKNDKGNPLELYMNNVYKFLLKKKNGWLKGELFFNDYENVVVKNGFVYFHEKRIHNLVEKYNGFGPREILDVYRAGHLMLYNGPIRYLLCNKLNIALLSENQDSNIFDPEERRIIKKYIPWTRQVVDNETTYNDRKIRLKDFMIENRERLVLKPAQGYAGYNILIGRYTPEEKWRERLESILDQEGMWKNERIDFNMNDEEWKQLYENTISVNRWVVQEYKESYPFLFQVGEYGCSEHNLVWGFLVWGSNYSGGWLRLLPKVHDRGIINTHQGAEASVIFEVDE